jgi:hypothetical protein
MRPVWLTQIPEARRAEALEDFNEIAAMLEYNDGQPRELAETWARERVIKRYAACDEQLDFERITKVLG